MCPGAGTSPGHLVLSTGPRGPPSSRGSSPNSFPIPFPHFPNFPFKMSLSCAALRHSPAVCWLRWSPKLWVVYFSARTWRACPEAGLSGGACGGGGAGGGVPWLPAGRAMVFACSGRLVCITDSSPRNSGSPLQGHFSGLPRKLDGGQQAWPVGVIGSYGHSATPSRPGSCLCLPSHSLAELRCHSQEHVATKPGV